MDKRGSPLTAFGLLVLLVAISPTVGLDHEEMDVPRGIVFILADDLRADFLGCTGREGIATPTIDGLAARGTRFSRIYCQGSRSAAVCLPSRSRMLAGRSDWNEPDWRLAQRRDELPLWPAELRDAGWRTHHIGKWHCGGPWFDRSFESGASVLFGGMGSHWNLEVQDRPLDGEATHRRIDDYSTREFGAAATDFLDAHLASEPNRPFVLSLCFTAPHDPRTSPDETTADARALEVGIPGNLLPFHPFDNGEMTIRDEELLPWPRTEPAVRREIAIYEQMIEEIDRQVADVVASLEEAGVLEETLIVFAGDHGLALGSHGLLGKQNLYEHSMRSPLVIAGPGFDHGGIRDDFAFLHDLAPTILGRAGIDAPESMDGRDLSTSTGRDGVLTRYKDDQRAWREDRWKIAWYPRIDHWQLFDLTNDPEETTNLATDPEHAGVMGRLKLRLAEARDEAGDDATLVTASPASGRFDHEAADAARSAKDPHWKRR
ncbi:MAG: sulfatase-like hydrolase/transferase [Phycisphaera sp.]|nr:sulfatase-like hydrolase/transferase [Phycisphaera sp.]